MYINEARTFYFRKEKDFWEETEMEVGAGEKGIKRYFLLIGDIIIGILFSRQKIFRQRCIKLWADLRQTALILQSLRAIFWKENLFLPSSIWRLRLIRRSKRLKMQWKNWLSFPNKYMFWEPMRRLITAICKGEGDAFCSF